MKLQFLISVLFISALQTVFAQDSLKKTYPIVVSFQSVCCGVPSETSLQNLISTFKKKQQVKQITASHIGPMGREGEYYMAFELKELTKKQRKDFILKISKLEKAPSDKGILSIIKNMDWYPANAPVRAKVKTVLY